MTRKVKPKVQVKTSRIGTFLAWYNSLDERSDGRKAVDEVVSAIEADISVGTKVPKDRWPKVYVKKYGINNLYKIDMHGGYRITYTILSEGSILLAILLDRFSHKEYEEFFGY